MFYLLFLRIIRRELSSRLGRRLYHSISLRNEGNLGRASQENQRKLLRQVFLSLLQNLCLTAAEGNGSRWWCWVFLCFWRCRATTGDGALPG